MSKKDPKIHPGGALFEIFFEVKNFIEKRDDGQLTKTPQGRSNGALAEVAPADLGSRGGGRGRGKPLPGDKGIGFCWNDCRVSYSKPPGPKGWWDSGRNASEKFQVTTASTRESMSEKLYVHSPECGSPHSNYWGR